MNQFLKIVLIGASLRMIPNSVLGQQGGPITNQRVQGSAMTTDIITNAWRNHRLSCLASVDQLLNAIRTSRIQRGAPRFQSRVPPPTRAASGASIESIESTLVTKFNWLNDNAAAVFYRINWNNQQQVNNLGALVQRFPGDNGAEGGTSTTCNSGFARDLNCGTSETRSRELSCAIRRLYTKVRDQESVFVRAGSDPSNAIDPGYLIFSSGADMISSQRSPRTPASAAPGRATSAPAPAAPAPSDRDPLDNGPGTGV